MAHGWTDRRGVTRGGTAIVIPYDSIEREHNETLHKAIERIRRTIRRRGDGKAVSINTRVKGKPRRLLSVYAPVKGTVAERTTFFGGLKNMINRSTYIGMDANCTPNPALDRADAATPL